MRAVTCENYFPKKLKNDISGVKGNLDDTPHWGSPASGGEQMDKRAQLRCSTHTQQIDSSWVEPHSPKVAKMFACHINVKLITS